MRPQTPLEMFTHIACEHAANTIAAIPERRAARLAGRLKDYANELIELADEKGESELSDEGEPHQPVDSRS